MSEDRKVKVMRVVCLLVFLCGVVAINIEAKALPKTVNEKASYSVALRGQVESVELNNLSSSEVVLVVKLKLELLNDGACPVIILEAKPPLLVGIALARSPDDLVSGKTLVTDYKGESVNTSPEWTVLRNSLNQPSPPPDKVRILMPNESWQLEESVSIALPTGSGRSGFFPKRESWERIQELSTIGLYVTYQMWSPNLELVSTDSSKMRFGHRLQKRWKNVGLLWLDGIRSEPITLDLKKVQS